MINSFKSFLIEEDKTIYFTFGRMNPPTTGHEKLMNELAKKSGKHSYRVYLSQSKDNKKNPLDFKYKVKTVRKFFPKHARQVMLDRNVKNVFDAVTEIYNDGYKNVSMVVGSDRIREFDVLLNKYNGQKARHGFYNFERINVISAGDRDPDADGAEGMSASKMRDAATKNDFTAFSQGLPKTVSNADAKNIYNTLRNAMGLKEEKEFKRHIQFEPVSETRENYISGGLYNIGDRIVIKETEEIGIITTLGSNYVIIETGGKMFRKWLDSVELLEKDKKKKDIGPTKGQDPDIKDMKGTQPAPYYKGLKIGTKKSRHSQFKRQSKMSDDNPAAYKPAPGDASGKTKPSKHTLAFKKKFGEDVKEEIQDIKTWSETKETINQYKDEYGTDYRIKLDQTVSEMLDELLSEYEGVK